MKLQTFGVRLSSAISDDVGVDVRGGALMIEDGPQSPSNDESARKVSVNGRERVGGGGGLQEQTGRGEGHKQREAQNSDEPGTHRARKTKTLVHTPA